MHIRRVPTRTRILVVLFLGLSVATKILQAQAQSQVEDINELFNIAASEHKQELYSLRGTRGLPAVSLPTVSAENIAAVLAARPGQSGFSPNLQVATYTEGTTVLFYAYAQDQLQIWLLNESGIQAYHHRNISEDQIKQSIHQLRNSLDLASLQISRIPHPRRSIAVIPREDNTGIHLDEAINEITEILLPEAIADHLHFTQHLIVVPFSEIGTVPYAVLKPFAEDSFLIDKMSISIAPSLFDLGAYVSPWNPRVAFSSPLIVGNPLLPKSDEWVVPPLPGAEREAQVVAELLGSEPLISAAATKDHVLAKVQQSSLLYFATHGISNAQNPLDGGFLMFSATRLEHGWWTAREIQNTVLGAEIAVLSACQTGLGGVHDAGIIGVARAFQISGVPRVVMSLWNVDDEATSELMQAFVRHLEYNDVPVEALRLAILDIKEVHPEPSKWASFVLFGSPR